MPTTMSEHKKALRKPPLCELLPVRDYLDGVAVQMDGSFVAGYELDGLNSYYHDDDMRNRSKRAFEALVRSLPERSMRMQVRFEITEGIGDVRKHYPRLNRSENPVLQDIDRIRMQQWDENEEKGFYLRHILHAYFIWNPRTHHEMADRQEGKKRNWFSLSADKCIQRERREHEDLLAEFSSLMAGVEQTLAATGMRTRRMTDDEMFVEAKRSLNPVFEDRGPYRRGEYLDRLPERPRADRQHQHRRRAGGLHTGRRIPVHLRQHEGPAGRHVPRYSAGIDGARFPGRGQCRGNDPGPDKGDFGLQEPHEEDAGGADRFEGRPHDQRGCGRGTLSAQ